MESKKEVEVELEEIATVEEDKEKEVQEKETKAEAVEEANIYSTLTSPSEHEYGVPSSIRSYTVNKALEGFRRAREDTEPVLCYGASSSDCTSSKPLRAVDPPVEPRCGQVRTRLHTPADYFLALVELRHKRFCISRNMYVKLCNFGKNTGGKSEPKQLQLDSDPSLDTDRKLRVYRIVSLVLFVICVLLLVVVLVLFMKLTGMQPCQEVEQIVTAIPQKECSLKKCQELYHPPQRPCSDCGRGWLRFENACYFLSENRLTWQQSREECQRKGGDLAVITNERVQMYLSKKGNLHYWIGLNHLGTSEWTWINNTALTVSYWGDVSFPGQCAILAANEPLERSWRPSSCSLYLQYICQKM